jgi:hypothetical protein
VAIEAVRGGHGGGDEGIMAGFVDSVSRGIDGPTDGAGALGAHLLAFAAERARLDGGPVDLARFRADLAQGPDRPGR